MWATKKTRLKSKNSKRLITGGAKIIILSFLISTLRFTPASTLTSQSSTGFQFSFNSSLSISLSSADLVIPHLTPGNYASSNTITVDVSTNNSYGYTLMAKVGDKNNPNLANNNLVNTDNITNNNIFTSLATSDNITLSNFSDSKWGYTTASIIDASTTTYSGLLYGIDTIINATKTSTGIPMDNTYPGTNTTNFTIAARASDTQTSGEYTNIINFRSVANVNTDITINDLRYMQDIASLTDVERQAVISSMVTGTSYQLQDSRDDVTYNVAKLKDGNIWLLDNLALDPATLKSGVTLDSTNTNLPSGGTFTLPNSTTTGFEDAEASYTTKAINTESKNASQSLAVGQSGTGKIGVYYNYCAATAGTYCSKKTHTDTNNATNDICPKGWRLPTGGPSGEFQALRNRYASITEYVLALRTPLSGFFDHGSALSQGSNGHLWSSTYYNATSMYALGVGMTAVYPLDTSSRHYGFSVRCVYDATPDMQNVTTSELATLMPSIGDTAILNDNRDGTIYNIGRLADNKFWMLDNLALDKSTLKSGVTLDSSNTNLAAGKTYNLPDSDTTGFDSSTGYTTNAINNTSKNTDVALAVGQSGTGKIGVYYNYCAASAGTYCKSSTEGSGNATSDICPKGWRLPTGGASGEFQALRNQYASDAEYVLALRTPLSGGFYDGSARYQGSRGYFWSSTYYNATDMYDLRVDTADVEPQSTNYRLNGFSVRCIKQ